ncbi:MAG: M20/M25/M40 family metallo-hydrolase [Phascolarctobacterium sp.]|nr:M20/M25/M40 family metallo-hydrolase [Phascolarctobacterium sp.]
MTGKAAYSGINPEEGINAIMLAAKALTAISKYGRIDSETTLNTGLLNGGVAFNVVAPEAKCAIDMRSLSVEKVNRMKDETFRILKAVVEECGGKFDAEIHEGCPPVPLKKDHHCITIAERAAEKLGFKPLLKTSCGCSDWNFLSGHGLPCAVLATGMSNIHTTGEYLKEEDLFNIARWVYEIIKLAAER